MHIDEANLVNLTGLWKKYGSKSIAGNESSKGHINKHWPHRCWFDINKNDASFMMSGHFSNTTWLDNIPESTVLPVWFVGSEKERRGTGIIEPQLIEKLLLEKKWSCTFEQTAMYLELKGTAVCSDLARPGFQVLPVHSPENIKEWVDIGSEAFAYAIDPFVIENLINDRDIQMYLGWQDGQAVAAALLYKTHDIIGIHQVGVKQAFQGQGIARCFMLHIIEACKQWQAKYLVLQASQLGQPLYESLGFTEQFIIKNYCRV
ncbi:hypothetical protein NBRC116188_07310 [Oceaniserpentilla sp. 4NH20-0058]|uniref:GNAT family N-acetyltransferase n=1 Tax=Oceaniserpentilla sp. 4NH20-0058 TaxID=3127660 RepID=UPI00310A3953